MVNPDGDGLVELTDATTSESLTVIQDSFRTKGRRRAIVEIGTSGGTDIDLDQFAVQVRVKEGSGNWNALASAWGTANETEVVIDSPTNLAALAHAAIEHAIVDFHGAAEARVLTAQAGVTGSAVTRTLKVKFSDHKGGN